MRPTCVPVFAVLFACLCAGCFADAAAAPSYEFGFRGGLNMGKLTGDDTEGIVSLEEYDATFSGEFDSYRLGFSGGIYFMAHLTDMFGLRLEALYVMRGGKGEVEGTLDVPDVGVVPFSADVTFKLDYIELPLLAVLSVPIGETVRFDAVAGPAFAFSTSSKLDIELGVMGYFIGQTEDIEDMVKTTDIGGVIGGGFTVDVGPVNLFIDGRWTFGFSSIDDSGDDLDVKNSNISFMGGVAVPLGTGM